MEKRKWPWKRKSSDKNSEETESSGSMSSHSERYSDDQETSKASLDQDNQSPEVTSKPIARKEDIDEKLSKIEENNDNIKTLTGRLSAALVNVSAKEDLVKQHAKVAEEAIAGWEKAENEVISLKQQLEAAILKNSALEDQVTHLDGALKECVRQLRQAKDEQEQKARDAVEEKTCDWESTRLELEQQLLELRVKLDAAKSESPCVDPDIINKFESLKKENSILWLELRTQSEELEIRTIERDLSTQAAEMASKQHLESIKKVAKLEAECRRLKALTCKSSLTNDHKSIAASSINIESFTDIQSDSGERVTAVEPNKSEISCSDLWASALISELDQFKNEKGSDRNLPSPVEINLMDDFLEMERLAALPESDSAIHCLESELVSSQSVNGESFLRSELESMILKTGKVEEKLKKMEIEKAKLEDKLEKMEAEKAKMEEELEKMEAEKDELEEKIEKMSAQKRELENALTKSRDAHELSQLQLKEAGTKLEELQKEFIAATEEKQSIECQLISSEAEARNVLEKVSDLELEVRKERASSAELAAKCGELEEELLKLKQEEKLRQSMLLNNEMKEELAVAAGRLAECQKTIASLGNQLQSLATLEDFLIDTANIPQFSASTSLVCQEEIENCAICSPKRVSDSSRMADESSGPAIGKNEDESPPSSSLSDSSTIVSNHVSYEKNRNGFAKFFSRTKSGIRLEI